MIFDICFKPRIAETARNVKEHYLTTLHVFWSSSPVSWDSDKAPNHSIFLSSGPATNSPGIGSRIAVLNPKGSNFPIPFPLGHICCWATTAYVYCIHFQILKAKKTHTFQNSVHKKLLQTSLKNHHTCSWFHCCNATPFELFEPTQLGNSKRWLLYKKQTYPTLATDSVISAMVHELGCQFHCIQTKFVASQQSTGFTRWLDEYLYDYTTNHKKHLFQRPLGRFWTAVPHFRHIHSANPRQTMILQWAQKF